jgi:hypothetical protein
MKIQINITSKTEMYHEYAGEYLVQSTKVAHGNYRNVYYVHSENQEYFENTLENDENIIQYQEVGLPFE